MGIGHEEVGNNVLFLGLHPRQPLAAAFLRAEIGQRGPLDVAARCDRHDHIFALDQILVFHVAGPVDDLGATGNGEVVAHFAQLVRDDAQDPLAGGQDFKVFLDLACQFFQLIGDFLDTDLRQTLQPKFQNGTGLHLREVIGTIVIHGVGRIVDQADVGRDIARRPAACHQLVTGLSGIGRGADGRDHLVHIGYCHSEAAQDVAAFTGLAQVICSAAGNHVFAEVDEGRQEAAQGQLFWPATIQRQHVAAERRLHGREAIQLVQHHLGGCVALEFDNNPHTVAVGFILNVGHAFDPFFADLLGDLFDHRGLVDLIGDFFDHDRVAVLADLLDLGLGPDDDTATAFQIRLARTRAAQHHTTGGEIGAGNVLDQLFAGQVRVLNKGQGGIHHLTKVVRRDVGRHANRNTPGAVDQHVREAGGQDRWFTVLAIVVVLEINRVFFDVGQDRRGRLVHADFGVTHRRRVIAVHRAKVALTVQKRQRHGEVLRHPHKGVIDRAVTMGVVFTHDIANRTGRLAIRFVMAVADFVHGVQNPAVNRFQTITQVGNGAADNNRHRIVEIRVAHLGFNGNRRAIILRPLRFIFVHVFRSFRRIAHVGCP